MSVNKSRLHLYGIRGPLIDNQGHLRGFFAGHSKMRRRPNLARGPVFVDRWPILLYNYECLKLQ